MATFDHRAGDGALTITAGLPGAAAGNRFTFPLDGLLLAPVGVALANVTGDPVNVRVRLLGQDGSPLFFLYVGTLGPREQMAFYPRAFLPPLFEIGNLKASLVVEAVDGPADSLAVTSVTLKWRGSVDGVPIALDVLPRDLTSAERRMIDAANAFSLALWARTNAAESGANVFVSPLSSMYSLGMTLNGAASQTLTEMRSALQLSALTPEEINEGYRFLIPFLSGIDPAVRIQFANSIWYRNDFPFESTFLDAAARDFGAEVRGLNFNDKAAALAEVNGWVDAKTNHKIPTILDPTDLNDLSVMFLVNAIYFNGGWRDKFDIAETRLAQFHAANGTAQPMSLMRRSGRMAYTETSTYQAVDLPYSNSAFTMTVVLPKSGTDVEALAASFTPASLQSLTQALNVANPNVTVELSLPKLKLTYERRFDDDLKALGMTAAFTPGQADFTRMSPRGGDLYIGFVKQKTFVDINEAGTEAAAATVTGVQFASIPPPPAVMRVDRPYIFLIRERLSGTLVFMGKITKMPDGF